MMAECKYCNFDETQTYFPTKNIFVEEYDVKNDDDPVYQISSGLQIDYDGNYLIYVGVVARGMGYQTGTEVNYCPMCGRKLGDSNEKV